MSNIISVKTLGKFAGASLIAISLGACTQMTKHSNMLVFGTNTSIGVNVGKDASQTPTIQLGIVRQEVALVPLLANTAATAAEDSNGNTLVSGGDLIPCPATAGKKDPPDNCLFVASNTKTVVTPTKDGQSKTETTILAKDSYSTLASFGTRTTASAEGAGVAVAQYFATGVAAQKLAENGGASVVMADSNSGKKADAEKAKADAEKAKIDMQFAKSLAGAEKIIEQRKSAEEELKTLLDLNKDGIFDQAEFDAVEPKMKNSLKPIIRSKIGSSIDEAVYAWGQRRQANLKNDVETLKSS